MPQQLHLPGFHPPDRPVEARTARAALARYPDLDGPTLSRYGKQLGTSGELLFDSLMMRLGERVVPADEHEHFDRVIWLPDRFLRVQIKTRTASAGPGFHFEIRKGYQRGPVGTKPYQRADFDLLALVVLPESVIRFTAEWRPSHVVAVAEIPGLRPHPRASFDDALPEVSKTCPLDVGSALKALATLQLGAAHAAAGSPGMIPPPGVLHFIEVPHVAARARIARIVDTMIDAGAGSGVQKPEVIEQIGSGKSVDARMFHSKIERVLLRGRGVIAITEVGTPLPDKLRRRAALTLPLAQVSAAMLRALLSEIHGIGEFELGLSDADAAALADLDFAAIFAAPSLEEARAQLARLSTPDTPPSGQVTLADVQGQPAARAAFEHLCADLVEWRAGALDWFEVTRSFLLHGPPGNGKTMLSEALAGSAGVPLIATSYADNQRLGHQGDMLKGLTEAVTRACDSAPSIFFIDEIDAFYTRGRSHNGYMIGVVTGLLTQLDRLMKTDGVILLAATNHPDTVDPAIRRAGRFDQHIPVTAPDRAGVQAILAGAAPDIPAPDLARLADRLLGRSGAEITAVVRAARTEARRRGTALASCDLDAAATDLAPAPDPDTLRRVTVHEAGHLLAGHLFGAPAAQRATLRSSGGAVERPMPDFLTSARVDALVRTFLGGRAPEAVVFDAISSGAGGGEQSDLAMATRLLIDAETRLGLGETLFWPPPEITARLLAQGPRTGIETALRTAEAEVRDALTDHRAELDRIAEALMDKRELTAKDLIDLLEPVDPDTARDTPDSVITPTS